MGHVELIAAHLERISSELRHLRAAFWARLRSLSLEPSVLRVTAEKMTEATPRSAKSDDARLNRRSSFLVNGDAREAGPFHTNSLERTLDPRPSETHETNKVSK